MPARLVLLLVLVVAALGALVAVLLTRGSDATASPYTGSLPPAQIRLPEFSLPDQFGQPVASSDLAGQVVLVTFLDTQCKEACPIVASVIGEGLRRLDPGERERVTAIAISVDPPEDTPESVAVFLDRHDVAGLLRYLVAPVDEIRPVWDDFAVASSFDSGDDNLHSVPVRIFEPDGIWASTLNAGADLTPENLAHDIRAALQS
jgi:cytochrome oxidase Cu insertion factor (SCO1/SenC/PrrC family)